MTTPSAAAELPDWMRPETPFAGEVSRLLNLGAQLRPASKFVYQHVLQASVHQAFARMAKSEGTTPKGYVLPDGDHPQPTAADIFTLTFNNGSALQMLRTHRYVMGVSLSNALDAFMLSLRAQLLPPAFSQLRALVEHAALAWAAQKKLGALGEAKDFDSAQEVLKNALETLNPVLYGTRINWKGLLGSEAPDKLLLEGKLQYEPEANRSDNTAKSILSSVDKLDKEVRGTRNVYEVLCEVTHPNIGHLIFALERATPRPKPDDNGVFWVDKTLALNPAGHVIELSPPLFATITRCCGDILERLIGIQPQLDEVEARLLVATQTVLRHMLKNKRDAVRELYGSCPCGSDKKLKFCCAARS